MPAAKLKPKTDTTMSTTNENSFAMPPYDSAHIGLTAREHAAIHLRTPMSGNEWLDAMITEARRWDAAQAVAAAGMTQAHGLGTLSIDKQIELMNGLAEICDRTANALIRQMKGVAQ